MIGETGPGSLPFTISMTIAGLFAVACFNCVEVFVLIFYTFKRYTGLYFWSMMVAAMGTMFYAIVNLLRLFTLAPSTLMAVLLALSWWGMVTGQSVVLYSRLHLVVSNQRKTRWVLIMIIANFFIIHIPLTVLWIGYNVDPNNFQLAFNIYERLQLVVFSIQEFIISGLYIWEASHGLKPIIAIKGRKAQDVLQQLVIINSLVILLDISVIITEYTGHLDIQTSCSPLVYSIKLKMEFIILNKLIDIIKQPQCDAVYPFYPRNHPAVESPPGAHGEPWSGSADMDHPTKGFKSAKVVMESETNLTSPEASNDGCHVSTSSSGPREPLEID
ncbi:hypothetical protein BGZ60DRAFT_419699 [Tricladium varicosporioides]|nr:hypothetical protein BGZ60DRAFT_419699 [Hymenoscyphus varicosporioides]